MKKVEIVVSSFKVNNVKEVLAGLGITKMTVSKVHKSDGQAGYIGYCRGGKYESKYEPVFLTKTKIELDVAENDLERILTAIEENAEGTLYGGEKIFVYSLEDVRGIRKKEKSLAAI
jgi:nitrogen regulatory protein PII